MMKPAGKTTTSILALVLLVSGFGLGPSHAQTPEKTKADTNREVALTYAQVYLEQKLYEEAEAVLQQSLNQDGQDGAVLNYLGLVQLLEKRTAQACYSFQTASILFKEQQDQIYALYNLADCLHRGGRRTDSIRVLRELEQREVGISNSAEHALDLIDGGVLGMDEPLPPYLKKARGKFRIGGTVSSGYDTNVLLIEESVSTGTPLSQRGSFYVTPSAQLGYLGGFRKTVMDARLISAYTNYFTSEVNGFNNLYNRFDVFLGSGMIRWGIFGDLVMLNNDGFGVYNYDAGVMWQMTRKYGANDVFTLETPLRYQKFILTEGVIEANDRTGADLLIRANYRSQWTDSDFWSLTGSLDNQYSTGQNYRLTALSLPFTVGLSLPLIKNWGLVNTFSAEVGGQYYWQNDQGRRDWWVRGGAGIIAPFFRDWNFTVDYYFHKNNSTISAATYSKGVFSFLLSRDFL
jgi:hypothetical protein